MVNRQRVLFALYPRTASVFAVVVEHPDNQTHAIYTGSATYGCGFHDTQMAIYYCEDSLSTIHIVSTDYFTVFASYKLSPIAEFS